MAAASAQSKTVATASQAQSVVGARDGWADFANANTEAEFNLTGLEGQYVKISCVGAGFWVCFRPATGQALVLSDQTTRTTGVPELVPSGLKDSMLVPKGSPFLRYKPAAGGTGDITVVPG